MENRPGNSPSPFYNPALNPQSIPSNAYASLNTQTLPLAPGARGHLVPYRHQSGPRPTEHQSAYGMHPAQEVNAGQFKHHGQPSLDHKHWSRGNLAQEPARVMPAQAFNWIPPPSAHQTQPRLVMPPSERTGIIGSGRPQMNTSRANLASRSFQGGLNPQAASFTPGWQTGNINGQQQPSVQIATVSPHSQPHMQGRAANTPPKKRVSFAIPENLTNPKAGTQKPPHTKEQLQHLLNQQQELLNMGCDIEAKMREIQRWSTTERDPNAIADFPKRMAAVVDKFKKYQEKNKVLADAVEQARLDFIISGGRENRRQWVLPRRG